MKMSTSTDYRDLHREVELGINTTNYHIIQYLNAHDSCISDKSRQLYNNRFLQYMKYRAVSDGIYFSSACKAEMQNIIYHVNIFIDKESNVVECQCECVTGQKLRAYCEHIVSVLLGIENFCRNKTVIISETCTSTSQSLINRSPAKAQNGELKIENHCNVFDPRPSSARNQISYTDYFQNTCLNFCDNTMPIMQLFEFANKYEIENDHTYSSTQYEDKLFEKMGLFNISREKISNVELETRGKRNNKRRHFEQSFRMTSKSFKKVCRVSMRKDIKLFVSNLLNKKNKTSNSISHSIIYEDVARTKYMDITKNIVKQCGVFIVERYPYLCASPDGLIEDNIILVIKCPYTAKHDFISSNCVPYIEKVNNKWTLKKSHSYYFDIMGQLLATDRQLCHFVLYTFKDILIIEINRDDAFIDNMIISLATFYESHFRKALKRKYFYKESNGRLRISLK